MRAFSFWFLLVWSLAFARSYIKPANAKNNFPLRKGPVSHKEPMLVFVCVQFGSTNAFDAWGLLGTDA